MKKLSCFILIFFLLALTSAIIDQQGWLAYTISVITAAQTGNLVIRVHNLPGHNMPGAGVVGVALWYGNYERYVGDNSSSYSGSPSYVSVSFSGLSPGNCVYEVYQTPDSGLRLREFWGNGFAEVRAGETRYADFYRHTQWITGFTVNGQAPSKDVTVRPGEKVSVGVTIKNEEGTSISAKARVILDRDRQAPYDYDRTSGALTISSKGSVTFSLPEYYPTEPGTYYMYVVAYGLYSDWTVTDQWVWSGAFTVVTPTYTLQLRSYSVDGEYSKFRITFDGTTYYTPKDLQVGPGTHRARAEYPGGELSCYDFHHWESSGNINVKDPNSRETDVTVNGDSMLKAIYGIRVYLSSETTDGKTDVGTITFDGKTYSLSSFSDPKLLGRYSATANPPSGYRFLRWETRDYISVGDPNSQTTTVQVNGFGVLKAVFTIAKPDLTVVSIRASPSEVYHGENLNVEFTEKNQGSADSGLFKTRIYLAGTEYGRDYSIGETEPHSLRAGETKTYSFPLPIPNTIPPGEYYVTVFIDHLNQVEESNENNNIGSTTPNKVRIKALVISLEITDLNTDKSEYASGESITFRFNVKNKGNVKATFLPVLKIKTPSGEELTSGPTGITPEKATLEPGEQKSFFSTKSQAISDWYSKYGPGEYKWGVILVDESGTVRYADTCYVKSFKIKQIITIIKYALDAINSLDNGIKLSAKKVGSEIEGLQLKILFSATTKLISNLPVSITQLEIKLVFDGKIVEIPLNELSKKVIAKCIGISAEKVTEETLESLGIEKTVYDLYEQGGYKETFNFIREKIAEMNDKFMELSENYDMNQKFIEDFINYLYYIQAQGNSYPTAIEDLIQIHMQKMFERDLLISFGEIGLMVITQGMATPIIVASRAGYFALDFISDLHLKYEFYKAMTSTFYGQSIDSIEKAFGIIEGLSFLIEKMEKQEMLPEIEIEVNREYGYIRIANRGTKDIILDISYEERLTTRPYEQTYIPPTHFYSAPICKLTLKPGEQTLPIPKPKPDDNTKAWLKKAADYGLYVDGTGVFRIFYGEKENAYALTTALTFHTYTPVPSDWNPWNDLVSEGGTKITTAELQGAIDCWLNDKPAPETGEIVSTERLQELISEWLRE